MRLVQGGGGKVVVKVWKYPEMMNSTNSWNLYSRMHKWNKYPSSIDTWLLFTTNSSFLLLSYFNCSFLCLLYLFDLLIKVCKISHYSTCHVGSLSWAVKQDDLYVMLGSRKLLLHLNVCTNYWSWKVISDKLLH